MATNKPEKKKNKLGVGIKKPPNGGTKKNQPKKKK